MRVRVCGFVYLCLWVVSRLWCWIHLYRRYLHFKFWTAVRIWICISVSVYSRYENTDIQPQRLFIHIHTDFTLWAMRQLEIHIDGRSETRLLELCFSHQLTQQNSSTEIYFNNNTNDYAEYTVLLSILNIAVMSNFLLFCCFHCFF